MSLPEDADSSIGSTGDGYLGSSVNGGSGGLCVPETPKSPYTDNEEEDLNGLPETKKNDKVVIHDGVRALMYEDFVRNAPKHESSWPYDIILVRHGQSEGNEAVDRSKRGDLSAYTPEFKKKHSSAYRLTDLGKQQAAAAGTWLRDNIADGHFDRHYTSEYVRAMETAALLDLPGAQWYTEIMLRERDKGLLDNTSAVEKQAKYRNDMKRRKRDSFFWSPPGGGESMAHICQRIDHTFNTLRTECANKRVVIVCHGELMWAFRVRLERLSQIRYHQLQASKDPRDMMHNGQILHYTRIHPLTGQIFPHMRFMRSICVRNTDNSDSEWQEFDRPTYSNEELLKSVTSVARFVNNLPVDSTSPPPTRLSKQVLQQLGAELQADKKQQKLLLLQEQSRLIQQMHQQQMQLLMLQQQIVEQDENPDWQQQQQDRVQQQQQHMQQMQIELDMQQVQLMRGPTSQPPQPRDDESAMANATATTTGGGSLEEPTPKRARFALAVDAPSTNIF